MSLSAAIPGGNHFAALRGRSGAVTMSSVPQLNYGLAETPVLIRTEDGSLARALQVALAELHVPLVDRRDHAGQIIVITDDVSVADRRTILIVEDVPGAAQRAIDLLTSDQLAAMVGRYDLGDLSLAILAVERNMMILPRALAQAAADAPSLDDRQRRILVLVSEGMHNGTIAERLHISTATVKREVSSLLMAFGAASRLELALAAAKSGYIE